MNNEIIIISQVVGETSKFQKIKNDICEFEKIIGLKLTISIKKSIAYK